MEGGVDFQDLFRKVFKAFSEQYFQNNDFNKNIFIMIF